jgi:hypothetical protein
MHTRKPAVGTDHGAALAGVGAWAGQAMPARSPIRVVQPFLSFPHSDSVDESGAHEFIAVTPRRCGTKVGHNVLDQISPPPPARRRPRKPRTVDLPIDVFDIVAVLAHTLVADQSTQSRCLRLWHVRVHHPNPQQGSWKN